MSSSLSRRSSLVVFGGNGYVGQAVCIAALQLGMDVVSISRRGKPTQGEIHHKGFSLFAQPIRSADWIDRVQWIQGDVGTDLETTTGAATSAAGTNTTTKSAAIRTALQQAAGVVTCLGAITGSEEV